MSGWNFRVLHDPNNDAVEPFRIIECYYGDHDEPHRVTSWSESHHAAGETLKELEEDIEMRAQAVRFASLHHRSRRFLTLADLPVADVSPVEDER